ncbi:hypothetical protein [Paenibacillus sp. SN-8-1]|uniref:hypothetical protein n=1 Tax=Paenibacillus sp. SN-8-1 TaxID=3435409 RepID=UPI003D9A92D9
MLFKNRNKKSNDAQLGMNTTELLLLFESRFFLHEIVKTRTRLSKWQKTLEEGSVYYTFSDLSISLSITNGDRQKTWIFTLFPMRRDFHIKFEKVGANGHNYIPLEEDKALINEIHDILVLIYFLNFLNTKNTNGFKKYEGSLKEHVHSMQEKYAFDYGELFNTVVAYYTK